MRTVALLALCIASLQAQAPKGWIAGGHHIANYSARLDRAVARTGNGSMTIKAVTAKPSGFRTVYQVIEAGDFRGKRVRLAGFVKTADVEPASGLWMRVEAGRGVVLAFDNMQDRPVTGTADWRECNLVLDVPESAETIAFGFMLGGTGRAWADDLRLEAVDATVPTTGLPQARVDLMNRPERLKRTPQWGEGAPAQSALPVNLDFER